MDIIRTLQRSPDGDALLGIEGRDHSVVFDVELFLRAGRVLAFYDVIGFFPHGVDVAFFNQVGFENVVRRPR